MVIKNKDGTVYKISQPNPIMIQQEKWNDFIIHNMNFEKNILEDAKNVPKKPAKLKLGTETTIKEEARIPLPTPHVEKNDFEIPNFNDIDNNVPEPTQESEKEQVLRPTNINEKLKIFKKDVMHCMLADTKESVDPLYDEKRVKVTYTKTFTFENIIIKDDDMQLVFWSHLDFLTKNSVVYPRNNTKRWWKISGIKKAQEGIFFSCVPTNVQPSFKS